MPGRYPGICLFALLSLLLCGPVPGVFAGPSSIIPIPVSFKQLEGFFEVNPDTVVKLERDGAESADVMAVAFSFADVLGSPFDKALKVELDGDRDENVVLLEIAAVEGGTEAYRLEISEDAVQIVANSATGMFRALQTLIQLRSTGSKSGEPGPGESKPSGRKQLPIPCVKILDYPRFEHRGMLLDCSRHFMSKGFIKRYIDLLAYHKMNVLHWHLTDDQGWRIEIKKYPRLTSVGAWRDAQRADEKSANNATNGKRYGGYYSQDDIREVVAHANSRSVTIVPEIEMPGHSLAALAAYPEISCTDGPFEVGTRWGVYDDVLCAGNDQTFQFIEDVLSEVIELFPSKFIHIGGDECPKTRWEACSRCQARIRNEKLSNEGELQSYFVKRVGKFLKSKGRRLIGWDEILEGGIARDAVVQSWRGMDGAVTAAAGGHDVIASPTSNCYLDYPQEPDPAAPGWMGFVDLAGAYTFEPVPRQLSQEKTRHLLGLEGNLWSERAPESRVDHQVFPRLCALAEVGWSPKSARNWDDFQRRMRVHYRRLDELGVKYCVPRPLPRMADRYFADKTEVSFEAPPEGATIRYTLDGSEPTPRAGLFDKPLQLTESTTIKARTYLLGSENASDVTAFTVWRLRPLDPVSTIAPQSGLRCARYDGVWDRLPDVRQLTPRSTGLADQIDLSCQGARDEDYALVFSGLLKISREGIYTFFVSVDDGCALQVGPDHALVLNATFGGDASGKFWLRPGYHPIEVMFHQQKGAQAISVQYEGPDGARRSLPPGVLFHER